MVQPLSRTSPSLTLLVLQLRQPISSAPVVPSPLPLQPITSQLRTPAVQQHSTVFWLTVLQLSRTSPLLTPLPRTLPQPASSQPLPLTPISSLQVPLVQVLPPLTSSPPISLVQLET